MEVIEDNNSAGGTSIAGGLQMNDGNIRQRERVVTGNVLLMITRDRPGFESVSKIEVSGPKKPQLIPLGIGTIF